MDRPVIAKFIRDDGKEFIVDCEKYIIPTEDGITGLDLNSWTLTSKPLAFHYGSIITSAKFEGRPLGIKFYASSNELFERDLVRAFFNPLNTFELQLTYMGVTRWIMGRIESRPMPAKNVFEKIECTVGLFCEDPFFNSMEDKYKNLQEIQPMAGWPYMVSADNKQVYSKYVFGQYVRFDNDGDMDVKFACYMYFTGTVVNPVLYQGYRDKKFQLKDTFTENDIVFIDFDTMICLKNDQSCYNLVSYDSEQLLIPRGGTYLSCSASQGETLLQCTIIFNEKFAGM